MGAQIRNILRAASLFNLYSQQHDTNPESMFFEFKHVCIYVHDLVIIIASSHYMSNLSDFRLGVSLLARQRYLPQSQFQMCT